MPVYMYYMLLRYRFDSEAYARQSRDIAPAGSRSDVRFQLSTVQIHYPKEAATCKSLLYTYVNVYCTFAHSKAIHI